MKEYLVSVTIRTEVQLVVEASSELDAGNQALTKEFIVVEKSGIPEAVFRSSVISITKSGVTPERSSVLTEITNPILKKRTKKD